MNSPFENEVKDMLTWTLKQWQEAGVNFQGKKRLVNSLKYWHGRLKSAMTNNNVIFTLYHENSRVYPSLQKVADLLRISYNIDIIGYAKFKNKRFLSISFQNEDIKSFVLNSLSKIQDCHVAFLQWVDEAIATTIKVDWLSNHTDLDLVMDYIDQYMEIQSANRESTILEDGTKCTSGTVLFKGRIKKNVSLDDIPHFDFIDGLECSITVDGRPYRCFVCLKLGHKAMSCTKAFCYICKKTLFKNHICQKTDHNQIWQSLYKDNLNVNLDSMDTSNQVADNITLNKVTAVSQNLFLNNKLVFVQNSDTDNVGTHTKEGSEVNQEESCIENYEWPRFNEEVKDSLDMVHSNMLRMNNLDQGKTNSYMTEELSSNDPNFILIDTSSEESVSDSENDTGFFDRASVCMSELSACVDVSRSLISNSLHLLKPEHVEKRMATEEFLNLLPAKSPKVCTTTEMTDIKETADLDSRSAGSMTMEKDNFKFKYKKKKNSLSSLLRDNV